MVDITFFPIKNDVDHKGNFILKVDINIYFMSDNINQPLPITIKYSIAGIFCYGFTIAFHGFSKLIFFY